MLRPCDLCPTTGEGIRPAAVVVATLQPIPGSAMCRNTQRLALCAGCAEEAQGKGDVVFAEVL